MWGWEGKLNYASLMFVAAVTVQVSEGPPLADVVTSSVCHEHHSEQAAPAGK